MNRVLAVILAVFLWAGLSGLSVFKSSENTVLQKGNHTWVKLAKADKDLRGSLDHPAELSEEQARAALTSVRYFQPSAMSFKKDQGKEFDILKPEEAEYFASYIAQAFQRAGSDQWVDFSFECFRGQGFIGVYKVTSGVMFIKDGELNMAFREIATSVSPEEKVLAGNPLNNPTMFERLVPGKGQRLAVTEGRRKQVTHENWVIMPVGSLAKPAATMEPAPAQPAAALPAAAPEAGQAPAPETPAAYTAPAQEQQAPAVKKPAAERMRELRELYDSGFITEKEYEEKRREILEEL